MLVFRRELAVEAPRQPEEAPLRLAEAAVQPRRAPEPELPRRPKVVAENPGRFTAQPPETTVVPVRREAVEGASPRLGPARGEAAE